VDPSQTNYFRAKAVNLDGSSAWSAPTSTPSIVISQGAKDIWWVDGFSDNDYPNTAAIAASNIQITDVVTWQITSGSGIAKLVAGGLSGAKIFSRGLSNVTVKTLGANANPKQSVVTVQLSVNGSIIGKVNFNIHEPVSAVAVAGFPKDQAQGTGFHTFMKWQILDNFGKPVPQSLPVNESFSNPVQAVANNWGPFTPFAGVTHADGTFDDTYAVDDSGAQTSPGCLNPGSANPGAGTLVQSATQTYRVGSSVSGKGIVIKSGTLKLYRSYARWQ
jgi:hypothetical protein